MRIVVVMLAVLTIGATAVALALTRPHKPRPSTPRPAAALYWGAWIGDQFTGSEAPWDWNAVAAFQRKAAGGKPISLVQWSSPFSLPACGGSCRFDSALFESVRKRGVIPFFSWANSGIPDAAIAAGKYDAYLTEWAKAAATWGHPFFLRFDWEMNGGWFPWGVGPDEKPNTVSEYVAAWRHVHDIFAANHATNATWVWCPNIDPLHEFSDPAALYPGDRYVDWTCLDGYNHTPWLSFAELYGSAYDEITAKIAPDKPMIIAEVSSTEHGGSKARWIAGMFATLRERFPKIRGFLWFETSERGPGGFDDWPVETSASATAAFARGIRSRRFTANSFASAAESPIRPPG